MMTGGKGKSGGVALAGAWVLAACVLEACGGGLAVVGEAGVDVALAVLVADAGGVGVAVGLTGRIEIRQASAPTPRDNSFRKSLRLIGVGMAYLSLEDD